MRLVSLATILIVTALAPTAWADKPAPASKTAPTNAEKAAELFKKSVEAYRTGEFTLAVDLLNQAYALDAQPVLLYNLARAYEGLGENARAVATYEKYLREDPKTKDRGSIEQRVETLKRDIAEKAALAQQRDAEKRRAEEALRAKEQQQQQQQQHVEPPPHRRSVVPYIVMGVGLAGVVTGGVFGVVATSTHSDAEAARSQEEAITTQDDAKSQATISTVAFIAGGVLMAAGAVWWFLDTPKSTKTTGAGAGTAGLPSREGTKTRLGVRVGPSSMLLEGAF